MNNPTPPTDFAERAARISLSRWAGETTTAAETGLVEGLDAIRLALLAIVDTGRNQVEQMRIGNLLAAADVLKSGEALAALRTNEGTNDAPRYRLRPEIRDALVDAHPTVLPTPHSILGQPGAVRVCLRGDVEALDDVVDAEIHCAGCQCPPDPCPRCGASDVLSAVHILDCEVDHG